MKKINYRMIQLLSSTRDIEFKLIPGKDMKVVIDNEMYIVTGITKKQFIEKDAVKHRK